MREASASVIVLARKYTLALGLFIIALIIGLSAYRSVTDAPGPEFQQTYVTFGGKRFLVDIADTSQKRMQGLAGREDIAGDEGMLFIFEQADEYCFWMKDVDFPIDIFWFNESFEVVESVISASPESYPERFCPDQPIKYVLEIRGGEVNNLENPTKLEIEHKR